MIDRILLSIAWGSPAEARLQNARIVLSDREQDAVEIPEGPVTRSEVIQGIRRLAYRSASENVQLRAWEVMGRDIGMFKESTPEGGVPVVRLTPPLDQPPGTRAGAGDGDT